MSDQPTNLPRQELLAHAQATIDRIGIPGTSVRFKFTCEKCGERCMFQEKNILYEEGECSRCGHKSVVREGGYCLFLEKER